MDALLIDVLPGLYRGLEGDYRGRTYNVTAVRQAEGGVRLVYFYDTSNEEHHVMEYKKFAHPGRFARHG